MAQLILKANSNVVPQQSHCPMKTEEVYSEQEQMNQKVFDKLIKRRWGTSINPPTTKGTEEDSDTGGHEFKEYKDSNEEARIVPNIEDTVNANGRLLNQMPAYNQILHSEVSLQWEMQCLSER